MLWLLALQLVTGQADRSPLLVETIGGLHPQQGLLPATGVLLGSQLIQEQDFRAHKAAAGYLQRRDQELLEPDSSPLRQEVSGAGGALQKMDQQLRYLLSHITRLIDPAIGRLSSACLASTAKTQSYGLSLVAGGLLDTAGDWAENSRTLQDVVIKQDVMLSYVYNIGYGLGFGGPFGLLPSYTTQCDFDCSSADFLRLARDYGLSTGPSGGPGGEARLHNFLTDARQSLACLLDKKGDSREAAQVDYLLEDLVAAGIQRIRLSRAI